MHFVAANTTILPLYCIQPYSTKTLLVLVLYPAINTWNVVVITSFKHNSLILSTEIQWCLVDILLFHSKCDLFFSLHLLGSPQFSPAYHGDALKIFKTWIKNILDQWIFCNIQCNTPWSGSWHCEKTTQLFFSFCFTEGSTKVVRRFEKKIILYFPGRIRYLLVTSGHKVDFFYSQFCRIES